MILDVVTTPLYGTNFLWKKLTTPKFGLAGHNSMNCLLNQF
ncbi:hypothetical protein RHIZ404_230513 [Rhizobium sp. EC-SD404]|nr:hypothetical protein RHIZ404_230513 [Rhizobium sp. EC-SD404]